MYIRAPERECGGVLLWLASLHSKVAGQVDEVRIFLDVKYRLTTV